MSISNELHEFVVNIFFGQLGACVFSQRSSPWSQNLCLILKFPLLALLKRVGFFFFFCCIGIQSIPCKLFYKLNLKHFFLLFFFSNSAILYSSETLMISHSPIWFFCPLFLVHFVLLVFLQYSLKRKYFYNITNKVTGPLWSRSILLLDPIKLTLAVKSILIEDAVVDEIHFVFTCRVTYIHMSSKMWKILFFSSDWWISAFILVLSFHVYLFLFLCLKQSSGGIKLPIFVNCGVYFEIVELNILEVNPLTISLSLSNKLFSTFKLCEEISCKTRSISYYDSFCLWMMFFLFF